MNRAYSLHRPSRKTRLRQMEEPPHPGGFSGQSHTEACKHRLQLEYAKANFVPVDHRHPRSDSANFSAIRNMGGFSLIMRTGHEPFHTCSSRRPLPVQYVRSCLVQHACLQLFVDMAARELDGRSAIQRNDDPGFRAAPEYRDLGPAFHLRPWRESAVLQRRVPPFPPSGTRSMALCRCTLSNISIYGV